MGIKGNDKDIYMKTNTMNRYNFEKLMNDYCIAWIYDQILFFVMNSLFLKTLYHHICKTELSSEESSSCTPFRGGLVQANLSF